MKIVLFEPQYPYGREVIFLSGGLMNFGSRLLEAGVEVCFFDLNFAKDWIHARDKLATAQVIGFTVIGPPYIPVVIEDIKAFRKLGFTQPILIGGEGVARVRPADFLRWFKGFDNVIQVQTDSDVLSVLGITSIRSAFDTSMAPMLRTLDQDRRDLYLNNEFALFMSNGCGYGCTYCAALKGVPETYRSVESLRDEVEYICTCLASSGKVLRVYLTNLDAFQNSQKLEVRLKLVSEIAKKHGVTVLIRCLATAKCTADACKKDPKLASRLHSYGLRTVGIGADGADEEVWRDHNKKHNTLSALYCAWESLKLAGIETEFLMVLGFQGDKVRSLWNILAFSWRTARDGAVLRPYLAKRFTPSGEWPEGHPEVERFLDDPELLLCLDYAAMATRETHPRWMERFIANAVYLTVIGLSAHFGKCVTHPIFPPKRGLWRNVALYINRRMPPDK